MDIRCPKCGEPWDIDSLHDNELELPFKAAQQELRTNGCRRLFGNPDCGRTPAEGVEILAELWDLAGDDIDGLASDIEDAEALGLFATEQPLDVECTACGGPLVLLGDLGRRSNYRCRNCGADASIEITRTPHLF